jgi:hypothetical protein
MQHRGALKRVSVVRHWLNAYTCLCEISARLDRLSDTWDLTGLNIQVYM